jgi:hypothetical protein
MSAAAAAAQSEGSDKALQSNIHHLLHRCSKRRRLHCIPAAVQVIM